MDWIPEKARKMLNELVEMALRLGRDPTFALLTATMKM